jgi:bifunctional DNA-binding transcriptional regulator/antitoxin component of YhaV-PrlF toxin-antitoxin module
MKAIVSRNGQLTLPAPLRTRDRIAAGQRFDVKRLKAGQYVLKRDSSRAVPGIWDWLDACPEKGWFAPLPSESTDSL